MDSLGKEGKRFNLGYRAAGLGLGLALRSAHVRETLGARLTQAGLDESSAHYAVTMASAQAMLGVATNVTKIETTATESGPGVVQQATEKAKSAFQSVRARLHTATA